MDPDPRPNDRAERLAAFSTWLVRERELRSLSRDDVLRATRLAPGVVEALEAGDPARLPPRAYALGYVRAYAGAVGLDPDQAALRYEEAAGEEGGGAGRSGRGRFPWLVAAAAVALAAGLALWAWLGR